MPLAMTVTSASRVSKVRDRWRPLQHRVARSGGQRVHDGSIVDSELGVGDEAGPNALRQKRFDVAGRRRQRDGLALGGQPLPDRFQVGGVGAVDSDHQGFPRGDDRGRQAVQKPVVPEGQRRQPQLKQALLAGPAFAVRRKHAACHPRRAPFVASVDAHGPAVLRGAARDGQPDDATADDSE